MNPDRSYIRRARAGGIGYFTKEPRREAHPFPLHPGHYSKVCNTNAWRQTWALFRGTLERDTRQLGARCPWGAALAEVRTGQASDRQRQAPTSKQTCKYTMLTFEDTHNHECAHRKYGTTGDLVRTHMPRAHTFPRARAHRMRTSYGMPACSHSTQYTISPIIPT